MQINDALFPIGGYTHSYGLETYIQKDAITNGKEGERYIRQNLKTNFLYTELLAVSLAFDASFARQLENLIELDELLTATKMPSEIRMASHKLGVRMLKMAGNLKIEGIDAVFDDYRKSSSQIHHATVYGALMGAMAVDKKLALEFYLYSAASNMITNCVKLIPLSQTAGQQILHSLYPLFEELIDKCEQLTIDDIGRSTPGLDIAAMQHETLYSRLYMS